MNRQRLLRQCLLLIGASLVPFGTALAGLDSFSGTDLENAAARANQATYDALRDPSSPNDAPLSDLSAAQIAVFENVRELVHTANEQQGRGPTEFSLGLDQEGLGFALRWTAAEEMSAQGSLATEIGKGQLAYLAGRLSTLRAAAGGGSVAGIPALWDGALANNDDSYPGDAASAGAGFSRLSGFINGSFGFGDKAPTDLEDAFDFDGTDGIVGLDYRLRDDWFVGGSIGFSQAEIDFDSALSIVDGGIESESLNFGAYALYAGERLYADASLNYSQIDYDIVRRIKYPSLNPNVGSVDETALSDTEGTQLAFSLGAGYLIDKAALSFEPFVRLDYLDTDIDAFVERNTSNGGFDLAVGDQSFSSLDGSLGVQLAYTLTPAGVVVVPYLRAAYHREFDDDQRRIAAIYDNNTAAAFGTAQDFQVATDVPDEDYYIVALGFSAVVRGGRVTRDDGIARGGLQIFFQYETIEDLDNYSNENITGGIRYEF